MVRELCRVQSYCTSFDHAKRISPVQLGSYQFGCNEIAPYALHETCFARALDESAEHYLRIDLRDLLELQLHRVAELRCDIDQCVKREAMCTAFHEIVHARL
jgi:hypothetical protein